MKQIEKENDQEVKWKKRWIENPFESALFQSRFLVLIPVVGILIASAVMFIKGSLEVAQGVVGFFDKFTGFHPNPSDDNTTILSFIPAIDNYLFATILLIVTSQPLGTDFRGANPT